MDRHDNAEDLVSIDHLVREIIDRHRVAWLKNEIRFESDLAKINVKANPKLIQEAVEALISHANEKLVRGCELSFTLIDDLHQWELEVADNVGEFPKSQVEWDAVFSVPMEKSETLTTALPFPNSPYLNKAYEAALLHGGQLQTWDCPQGGRAYVLVIPKLIHRSAA